jgi:hypothetical protein
VDVHAQGMLSGAEAMAAMSEEAALEAWPPVGGTPIELTGLYSTLQARGFGYGPAFQGLREAWRVGDAVYGRAVLPEALSESAEAYGVHPALLDAALHVLGLAEAGDAGVSEGSLLLPFEWSEVSLLASGARELRVRASVERSGEGGALAQLQLADGSGRAVARVGGLRLREASEAQLRAAARSEVQHLYRVEWRPVALSAAGRSADVLIVGGDESCEEVGSFALMAHALARLTRRGVPARLCSIILRSRMGHPARRMPMPNVRWRAAGNPEPARRTRRRHAATRGASRRTRRRSVWLSRAPLGLVARRNIRSRRSW